METDQTEIGANWSETKDKLKRKFALLTGNANLLADGKQDLVLGRLQQKLGKSEEEIRDLISTL